MTFGVHVLLMMFTGFATCYWGSKVFLGWDELWVSVRQGRVCARTPCVLLCHCASMRGVGAWFVPVPSCPSQYPRVCAFVCAFVCVCHTCACLPLCDRRLAYWAS